MRTAEGIGWMLVVLGVLFKELHWPFASLLLILGSSAVATLYFPLGYFLFGSPTRKEQVLPITVVGGLAMSIALIGSLFKLQWWPMSGLYLFLGITGCVLVVLLTSVLRRQDTTLRPFYRGVLVRAVVCGLLAGFLYAIPGHAWRVHRFPNNPRMVEMLDSLDVPMSVPARAALQQRINAEWDKAQGGVPDNGSR